MQEGSSEEKDNDDFSILSYVFMAVEGVGLVVMIKKTFQYIKESGKIITKEPEEKMKYCKELPFEGITPGQAEFLKDVDLASEGNIFMASLLSLKEKEMIDLIKIGPNKELAIKMQQEEADLLAEEKTVFDFLIAYCKSMKKEDKIIPCKYLENFLYNHKEKTIVLKKSMEQAIKKSIASYDVMADRRVKKRFIDIFIYLMIAILVVIIHKIQFHIFTLHTWIYILAVVNMIHCFRISTRTDIFGQEGVNYREKLKALDRYMKDFATVKSQGLPEIDVWNHLMIYAMAFGKAPNVEKTIKKSYPNIEETSLITMCDNCEELLQYRFRKLLGRVRLK